MLIGIGLRKLPFADLLVGIASMCLLTFCAQRPQSMLARVLSWGSFPILGTFSYSLYLVHFPLQQIIWEHFVSPLGIGKTATFAVVAVAGTPIILCLSYGFYLLFEKPFCKNDVAARIGGYVSLRMRS
jgi:peptidoglycan/LPS O-acetylase OafA/YrhL